MVYINLLPIREIKKRIRAKQEIYIAATVVTIVIALLAIGVFFQNSEISKLNNDISSLNNEKKKYTKVLSQIKTIEDGKKLLEKQIAIINRLNKSSALTVHVMDEVAKLTPPGRMWLLSMSQSGSKLNLSGMALDNRTIASYLDDLRTSKYITDVNLTSTSLKAYAGKNLKYFAINCTVSVPADTKEN